VCHTTPPLRFPFAEAALMVFSTALLTA